MSAAGFLVTGGPLPLPSHTSFAPSPVLPKYSWLSDSPPSSLPGITKGLQMVRLSGSLPHKSVGFIFPFSPTSHICWLWASWTCFVREEGCSGSLDGLRALYGL